MNATKEKFINDEIILLRKKLEQELCKRSIHCEEVLEISKEMDSLIVGYYSSSHDRIDKR